MTLDLQVLRKRRQGKMQKMWKTHDPMPRRVIIKLFMLIVKARTRTRKDRQAQSHQVKYRFIEFNDVLGLFIYVK